MKKIGILTFHRTTNFGALLHTIALCAKIKALGVDDVEIIDYHCRTIEDKELPTHKKIWWSIKGVLYHLLITRKLIDKEKSMAKDLRKYANLSAREYTKADIASSNSEYDMFMVGSDVVWGLDFTNKDYTYFLDFVEDNNKKVAFSSSVGNTDKNLDDKLAGALLKQFRMINVRESQAAEWVKSLSGKQADVVCDPTLLLTGKDWDSLIAPEKYDDKYLLIYFGASDKIIAEAKEYASKHHLKIKHINYHKSIPGTTRVRPTNLAQFIGLIKNAQMLFTDSYHGLLFAINYNRQVRFYNRSGLSRMSSIASMLDIEKADASLCPLSEIYHIDYDKVNPKLNEFRDYSITKLKQLID